MKNLEKRIWISQTHTIGQWINESIKNHSKKKDIAILMLSGGTTGTPKIVPLSHEMIYWH